MVVVQDDAKEVAQKAAALPKVNGKRDRMVIITQGSKSTVVAYKGEVKEFAVPAVPAEEIVDLNGAGDSFVGGFLAKFTQNKSLVRAPIPIEAASPLAVCFNARVRCWSSLGCARLCWCPTLTPIHRRRPWLLATTALV